MPRFKGEVNVGDVIVTREGPWYVSLAIRLAALLRGKPAVCNHVIIVHHKLNGTWYGIEGTPNGVDYVDITSRLTDRWTNANNEQPKMEAQRYLIAKATESLLGTGYDWVAILQDGEDAFSQYFRWMKLQPHKDWTVNITPHVVVCSSFADWAYQTVGLPSPNGNEGGRFTTPGDWDWFIIIEGWKIKFKVTLQETKGMAFKRPFKDKEGK